MVRAADLGQPRPGALAQLVAAVPAHVLERVQLATVAGLGTPSRTTITDNWPQRSSKKSPGSRTWSTVHATIHTRGHMRWCSSSANDRDV